MTIYRVTVREIIVREARVESASEADAERFVQHIIDSGEDPEECLDLVEVDGPSYELVPTDRNPPYPIAAE